MWAILGLVALPCSAELTEKERDAKFPYDLGPDRIDISRYPTYQQQTYEMFMHTCSICHTPARAINSPYVKPAEWSEYVQQMHVRAKEQLLTPEDSRRVVDFLAYDAYERKVKKKKCFDALQARLNAQFVEIQKQKAALQEKKN